MRHRSFFNILVMGLVVGVAALVQPAARADWVIQPGYDLFQTVAADTSFPGLGNLMGVPLGTFNFGGGPVATGPTDTIVQRLDTIDVPPTAGSSGTTKLMMSALQLETVTPVNFMGNGLGNYFVTLTPSVASMGTLTATFSSNAGGTFTSTLDVFFDIHFGSLTGPVVDSSSVALSTAPSPWGRIPPPGAVTIPLVNQFLLGAGNTNGDFWINKEIHQGPHGVVTAASIPEPSTWIMG